MKIKYFGHSCFALQYANGTVLVTDPFDETVTYAPCNAECTAALVSHDHFDHNHVQSLRGSFTAITEPGEYEIGGVKITAAASFHDEQQGALRGRNLIFRIEGDGVAIAHLGDLGHMPNDAQKALLKNLDILMPPIGGTYTIDTPQAEALIADVQPRHTIAMHFKTPAYSTINITTCEAFAKDMNAECMPREIEFTAQSLPSLPSTMIMNYE